ncbi:HAD family hydrolase [Actinomadura chibensis]|uniref:HAD family hydrolase n=1 Tax=Actinomadura chibensis TaxID=392828 RepID=A0A5D0NSY7_9ACTN|nr:HAD family hydrolase [Actinomadura chibensis]TYB47810.1 HAD family hydrolase [Actinomadura chibensis]
MTANRALWRARRYGGPITHVALDYGHTLTSGLDPVNLMAGMRPVTDQAKAAVRALEDLGVTLALVSETGPGHDRRPALHAARLGALFEDRVYLSHELGLTKSSRLFYRHVLDDLAVQPGELLVCGNNLRTDAAVPAGLGIRAVLLGPQSARPGLPPNTTLITRIGDLPDLLTGKRTVHA